MRILIDQGIRFFMNKVTNQVRVRRIVALKLKLKLIKIEVSNKIVMSNIDDACKLCIS